MPMLASGNFFLSADTLESAALPVGGCLDLMKNTIDIERDAAKIILSVLRSGSTASVNCLFQLYTIHEIKTTLQSIDLSSLANKVYTTANSCSDMYYNQPLVF
jgi:hypothetical protein